MVGNKATIAGLPAGLVAVSIAFAAYASGNNAATGAESLQQLLFVQTAASGLLAKADSRDSQEYILILTTFLQRRFFSPIVLTGCPELKVRKTLWITGHSGTTASKSDPPNGALELVGAAEHEDVAVLELSDHVYDPEAGTLQYEVKTL